MSMFVLALAIALIAGAMSVMLFYAGLKIEHDKKHKPHVARNIFIWAVLFLGAAFGSLEWSFYLLGYNMFTFFAFPLVAFFAIWFGWIIWLFEQRGERIVWIVFLIALAILTIAAFNCMNCLATFS
jgi:cation transport ATPase